jgi:hypothetical protein
MKCRSDARSPSPIVTELRSTIAMTVGEYLSVLREFERTPADDVAQLRSLHAHLVMFEDVLRAQLNRLKDL